tara:strand:+ start:627 stop:1544 length:918 start_codon:yes stop_codon:yes gene_type:complete
MNDLILANKYRILDKLHETKCSCVYSGINIFKNEEVIVKIENNNISNILKHEADIYLYLMRQKQRVRIPKFKFFGVLKNFNYIILQKMNQSLKDVFEKHTLILKDVCKIGIQIINLLERFHLQNLIHRDIKPENIVFDNKNNIYLIDFGLSTTYKDVYQYRSRDTDSSIEFKSYLHSKGKNTFVGNIIFSSNQVHEGYDYYPKDDLISLSYLLIYLYFRELPWSRLKIKEESKNKTIELIKKNIDFIDYYKKNHQINNINDFTLFQFFYYTHNLTFDTSIDYSKLRNILYKELNHKSELLNFFSY